MLPQVQPLAEHAANSADLDCPATELRPTGIISQIVGPDVIISHQNFSSRALTRIELNRINVIGHTASVLASVWGRSCSITTTDACRQPGMTLAARSTIRCGASWA